ncbi:MAG TPA: periplasmic heavy metal sensor [Gemmatimonadales bacterium]
MRSLVLAIALAAGATPVAAQAHPSREMPHREGMGQGMGQGMMGGGILKSIMPFAPDALLKHGDHLGLTADQVAKLTQLRDQSAAAIKEGHQPAHAAHMSLNQALTDTPDDTTAIREFFLAHHTAEGNMEWIRASAAFQARAVLTAEQRTMVESMAKQAKAHDH